MTDAQARILARLRRLASQGRRPELTCGDVATLLGVDDAAAANVLRGMVQTGALRSTKQTNSKPSIYREAL
jgi:DNA-binding IclR family transcriptional regulator